MKKLLWKLERNDREYTVVSRNWTLIIYYIVLSPIYLLCFIFKQIEILIKYPLNIKDSRVIVNGENYDKLTKKDKRKLFKRLTQSI